MLLVHFIFIMADLVVQVLEVRPVIDWNKGKAVEFLMDSLGLSDCDDVLPIYIGDDRTDEDAFKVTLWKAIFECWRKLIPTFPFAIFG